MRKSATLLAAAMLTAAGLGRARATTVGPDMEPGSPNATPSRPMPNAGLPAPPEAGLWAWWVESIAAGAMPRPDDFGLPALGRVASPLVLGPGASAPAMGPCPPRATGSAPMTQVAGPISWPPSPLMARHSPGSSSTLPTRGTGAPGPDAAPRPPARSQLPDARRRQRRLGLQAIHEAGGRSGGFAAPGGQRRRGA